MASELTYNLKRHIYYEIKTGFYMEDPMTKKKTGFLFDEEIKTLEKGKPIIRRIESVDGEHGCDLAYYNPEQTFFRKLLKSETAGQIVDYGMREYPFDVGELVEIRLKRTGENVEIHIKVIKENELENNRMEKS